jgi:hypothetical protein
MSGQHWRMTVYDLGRGASCAVSDRSYGFVYAQDGAASITTGGVSQTIEPGDGAFATVGARVASPGNAWFYEIAPSSLPLRFEVGLEPALSRIAILDEGSHILRADRVESQAGAQTPAHRHRGPGIRRLEHGLLRAEVGEDLDRVSAGGAWFETGHESVVGTNISGGVNIFVRVMLLPAELAGGKSSFIATTAADAAKPRAVNLRLFGELPIA